MSILREITNTVAAAIVVAGLSTPAFSQDLHADNTATVDRTHVTTQGQQAGGFVNAQVPDTELQFRTGKINGEVGEITPEVVSRYARQGQIKMPVAREENAISLEGFFGFREKRAAEKKAGIFIGVVVGNEPYRPLSAGYDGRDQFRDVHKRIAELMSGYEYADVGLIPGTGEVLNEDTRVPGFAEVYGAEVQGIIPLKSHDGAEVTYPGDLTVPIREGDILIMINDTPLVFINADPGEEGNYEYGFPDTVEEMEVLLKYYLARDTHLYTYEEHIEHSDAILLAAQNKYGEHFVMRASERASAGDVAGSEDSKPDITAFALNNN